MRNFFLLLSVSILLQGCWDYSENRFFENRSDYEPVLLSREEFENSIKIEENQEMEESSKIYIIDDYIFINDKRRGFHIFDNTDESNPIKKKFLNIPGATDVAIRDGILFINQANDLVVLTMNFSSFTIQENKRIRNVFPDFSSPDGFTYYPEENEVLVNYKEI
ncbi:hypothetical protein N9V96_03860 [Polaribacter sp.]|nr:hypothetical protein [Polaribacter sp.]